MPTMSRRAILSWVFWIALAVRIICLICLQNAPFADYRIGDAARYDQWAHEIAAGNWLGNSVFYQAPLYPYLLAGIYATLGDQLFTIRLIQSMLGVASCLLIASATIDWFGRRCGLIAGIIMATYAPAIFYEGLIQKSSLDLFLVSAAFWLITRDHESPKPIRWLWIGLVIGGLCLTRENALLAIPVLAAWISAGVPIRKGGWRGRGRYAVCFAAGLAILLIPVAARNAWLGGQWHLTTSQLGPNLYIGNNPDADGSYAPLATGRGDAQYEAADARHIAEQATGRELKPGEVSQYFVRQSLNYMTSHPLDWLGLMGRKTLLALNATEMIDTEDQYTCGQWSPLLAACGCICHFGLLLPLALCGGWISRSRWRDLWWIYALIAVIFATLIGFFVFSRYRLPLVPLLIPFAALGLDWLWHSWSRGDLWRAENRKWAPVPILIFGLSFCPLVDRSAAVATTYCNYGAEALKVGRYGEAHWFLAQAVAIKPQFVEARNNLAIWFRVQGDWCRAVEQLKIALDIAPDYAAARTNLDSVLRDLESANHP